jgi:tetratricopeptide (TPR) repeat protein
MLFFRRLIVPVRLLLILVLIPSGGLLAHGDLSERIAEMKAEIAQHPEDGPRQLSLAGLLFQDGNFAETLEALDDLDRVVPGKFPTDKLRGSAMLALQRPAEAREALNRFLIRFPGDVPATILRARALSALSLTNGALNDYREALGRSPVPEPDLVQEVATALASAGCQDEALSVLDRGLKTLGNIPSLGQRALDLELSLKRFDGALARAESMQRTAPRPEQGMAMRAAILTAAGRITESRESWQALITHLTALPAAERGSNAMSRLAEEARARLHALRGLASLETRPQATPVVRPAQSFSLTTP